MDISLSKIIVKVGAQQRFLFQIPSFKITGGEKLLIRGASGQGKTTFLHLLAGLFLPHEGYVRIGDRELTKMDEEERALFRRGTMSIIFQRLNLMDHLTALENIMLSLEGSKRVGVGGKEAALEALRSVGLGGRENDRTAVLSLGEQQRVAIARVLVSGNPLILADEPTSSLDEKNTFEVLDLLMKTGRNKTLIVVSHDHRIEKYFSSIKNFEEIVQCHP